MTKLRDVALIIAAAVLIFFAGSNIDLSSGLDDNALYLAVLDVLQDEEPADDEGNADAPLDSAPADDEVDESGDASEDGTALPIEVSLEPDTTIAYPSGTKVEFTLTITNTTDNEVNIAKIEDDQFGFFNIVDGKCEEDETELSIEIDTQDKLTCTYQGEVKAAAGETFTNTVSVTTQDGKVATASVDTEISQSIAGIFPGNQITILGKNGWPLIKNNVISEPIDLVIRDNNTDKPSGFVWGPVYSLTSGKSVDISVANDVDYDYEIEEPDELSKVTLDLEDKNSFLPPGEYTTEIFIEKEAEPEAGKVTVNVSIGYHWGWIVFITSIGVITTRLLFWWKDDKRHKVNWADLRAKWMDLLTEDMGWTSKIPEDAKKQTLDQIRKDVRVKVEDILNWLSSLEKGGVSIGQIKDILPKLQSLEAFVMTYLSPSINKQGSAGNTITTELDKIGTSVGEKLVGELISGASKISKRHLDNLKNHGLIDKNFSEKLETAKKELEEIMSLDDTVVPKSEKEKLGQVALLDAPIEVISKAKEDFQKQNVMEKLTNVTALNTPEEIQELIKLIKPIFDGFEEKVVKVIDSGDLKAWQDELGKINNKNPEVTSYIGKIKQIISDLKALSGFVEDLKTAEFPSAELKPQIEAITGDNQNNHGLQRIKKEIPNLRGEDINPDYLLEKMFSPILRDFKEADQGYNSTDIDLEAHWEKSQHKYIANARIIRSARDLERLSKFPSYDNNHIRRAYENLLANQGLEVEISTQRAIEVAILPPSEEDLEAAVKAVEYALECGNDVIIFREHRLTFEIFTVYCLKIFPDIKKENEKIDDYLKEKISDQVKKYSISKNEDVVNKINEIVNEMDSIKKLKKETNDEINKVVSYGWSGLLAKSIDKAIRTRQLSETYNTFANEIRVMAVAVQLSEAEKTKLANEIRERERAENMRPARQKCLLTIAFTVLTIIVATVLVIYGYELFGNLNTWGTPFDWLTAFVVGILAERLEKPTTNLIDSIAEAIKKLGKGEEVGGGGGEAGEAEASAEG